jgi:hypothetical protein
MSTEHGEDNEVQTFQGFGQALLVTRQPPETVEPAEAAFDRAAARQQHRVGHFLLARTGRF